MYLSLEKAKALGMHSLRASLIMHWLFGSLVRIQFFLKCVRFIIKPRKWCTSLILPVKIY